MAFELGFHTQKCKCPWVHIHVHTQTQYSHLLYVSTALINLYLDCVAVSIVCLGFDFDVLLGTVISKSGRSLPIFTLGISTATLLVIQRFTKVLSISHFALRSGQDTTRTLGCWIPDCDLPFRSRTKGLGFRHLPLRTGILTCIISYCLAQASQWSLSRLWALSQTEAILLFVVHVAGINIKWGRHKLIQKFSLKGREREKGRRNSLSQKPASFRI